MTHETRSTLEALISAAATFFGVLLILAFAVGVSSQGALKGPDAFVLRWTVISLLVTFSGLIAWVRRNLTSHLREPYLDPTLERQVAFNRQLVNELREISQRQTILLEYLSQLDTSLQVISQRDRE